MNVRYQVSNKIRSKLASCITSNDYVYRLACVLLCLKALSLHPSMVCCSYEEGF